MDNKHDLTNDRVFRDDINHNKRNKALYKSTPWMKDDTNKLYTSTSTYNNSTFDDLGLYDINFYINAVNYDDTSSLNNDNTYRGMDDFISSSSTTYNVRYNNISYSFNTDNYNNYFYDYNLKNKDTKKIVKNLLQNHKKSNIKGGFLDSVFDNRVEPKKYSLNSTLWGIPFRYSNHDKTGIFKHTPWTNLNKSLKSLAYKYDKLFKNIPWNDSGYIIHMPRLIDTRKDLEWVVMDTDKPLVDRYETPWKRKTGNGPINSWDVDYQFFEEEFDMPQDSFFMRPIDQQNKVSVTFNY